MGAILCKQDLPNLFSAFRLCFSTKIQRSCQTCITNDSVCLYKRSGILCNGTVYSSQIYVKFQVYFLIITCFSGNRRLKRKDTRMWESVDTSMQTAIKRLLGEHKCRTSFLFWSPWLFSLTINNASYLVKYRAKLHQECCWLFAY